MMMMRKKYRGTNRGPLKPYRRDVRMYREPPTYTRNAIVQSAPAVYRSSARADRAWAPFGKSKTVKHRYSTFFSLNPGVGVSADRIFMANGMYDTDVSGTGHQPYGYDQMSLQYNQWTVLRSKITVTVYNNQSGLLPFWLAIALRDDNAPIVTDPETLREQPGLVMKLVSPQAGNSLGVVTQSFDTKSFFNVKDPLGDSNLEGGTAIDPGEKAYFHVLMCPQNGTDDLASNVINVDIEFTATWTGVRVLPQS